MHTLGMVYKIVNTENEFKTVMNEVYDSIMEDSYVDYCDIGSIKKLSGTCSDYKEAEKRLDEAYSTNENYSYAIKYLRPRTSTLKKLEDRLNNEIKKKNDYEKNNSIHNHKSKTITCSHCKSNMNISYIKGESCPLCGTTLKSKTVQDTINRYIKNINDLQKNIKEEKKKMRNSSVRTTKSCSSEEWVLGVAYNYHS